MLSFIDQISHFKKYAEILSKTYKLNLHTSWKSADYERYSRKSRNVILNSLQVEILRTTFSNCISPKRGGAIFIQNTYSTLQLLNSGFYNCHSHFTNGALFFAGRECLTRYNCYDNCTGRSKGNLVSQAFLLKSTPSYYNVINYTTITSCSPFQCRGSDTPSLIYKGNILYYNCNSSCNHINNKACGISLIESDGKSVVKFNDFYNNTGVYVFDYANCISSRYICNCNFIQNEIDTKGSILLLREVFLYIYKAIFAGNSGKLIFSVIVGDYSLDSCVVDFPMDHLAIPKNVAIKDCKFGASHISFNSISSMPNIFCWNDCGNNENCIRNIAKHNFKDFSHYIENESDENED